MLQPEDVARPHCTGERTMTHSRSDVRRSLSAPDDARAFGQRSQSRRELRHRARDHDLVERAPLDPVGDRAGVLLVVVRAVLRVSRADCISFLGALSLRGCAGGRGTPSSSLRAYTQRASANCRRVSRYARRSSSRSARGLASSIATTARRAIGVARGCVAHAASKSEDTRLTASREASLAHHARRAVNEDDRARSGACASSRTN